MKKQNIRTLALIFVTLVYLLIGAAIFEALELDFERQDSARLADEKRELCERLEMITGFKA